MNPTNINSSAVQSTDDTLIELSTGEVQVLYQHLRMLRHAVNNHVAVMMAMAELNQRHPGQGDKFSQMCLDKGPQIVSALRRFSDSMEALLHIDRRGKNDSEA